MKSKAIILDGYVDEPTCLGVPPYISPYVRYIAGVLVEHGYTPQYLTIDQLRVDATLFSLLDKAALVMVIAGLTVPGKYLGGTPITLTEIQQIGSAVRHATAILGGPILFGYARKGGQKAVRQGIIGYETFLEGSPAESLDSYLNGGDPTGELDYTLTDRWSKQGSEIITQHPSFPNIMCELETATGCPRLVSGGCSFCTEQFHGYPLYRSIEGIAAEVAALASYGAQHFRLGKQPDILIYGTRGGEFPEPNPRIIENLFKTIRNAAPTLLTLHVDNVNPGTITHHEDAAREALRTIVQWHTPGDVAALGMETADPAVVRANNLKAYPHEMMRAIQIINEVGSNRQYGIPDLLPGLNFVMGLAGETEKTYNLNFQFLRIVLNKGYLIRRVNIRQLMPFEGTRAYSSNTLGRYQFEFKIFKEKVRKEFDLPMLGRVFPIGTVLRNVIIEIAGNTSFGRQMGSYPLLVGIPLLIPKKSVVDVIVVDYGMRSITGIPYPVEVNSLPIRTLIWLPCVGKKRARTLVALRPIKNIGEFRQIVGITPIDDALVF